MFLKKRILSKKQIINLIRKRREAIKKRKKAIKKNNLEIKKITEYKNLCKWNYLKPHYNSKIPLHVYMTWQTKTMPHLMQQNYNNLVSGNPKLTFHLYDDNECREFIKNNFPTDVLNAFDTLIPGAYKADLWRYCILYINGGIYMDIKYQCVNGFKFITLTEKEHFVRDVINSHVYNALIVTLPNNEIMRKCIYQIVENVKNKYYGNNSLNPTGPGLLGNYFSQPEKNTMDIYHNFTIIKNKLNEYYIVQNDRIILRYYNGYRDEQNKSQKTKHYGELWNKKNIYHTHGQDV